jgi:hypothetical protein
MTIDEQRAIFIDAGYAPHTIMQIGGSYYAYFATRTRITGATLDRAFADSPISVRGYGHDLVKSAYYIRYTV